MWKNSREVRLGLVMYGGVSLAMYENGVAQELFKAQKGEFEESGKYPKLGAYDVIKALADSDVVVDVMSGASAGGINGIFLAFALANGKDFRAAADLWRNKADILSLVRKTDDKTDTSLMDSRGFYQTELQGCFETIRGRPYGKACKSEIDLFVTGTNIHGRVFTTFDDQGHPIDVKDHRSVFMLSYREGRKNEFDVENISALAKLARVTSAFPVAFEPVHVVAPYCTTLSEGDDPHADKVLRRWGQLTEEAYFMDGGVLDNKPFSYTIGAIFSRLADREVSRFLFYIEPDPEQFANRKEPKMPDVVQSAVDALISIPSYESISGDLQSIKARNDKLAQYAELAACAKAPASGLTDPNKPESDYLNGNDRTRVTIYLRSRLAQLRDRALLGILKEGGELQLLKDSRRHAAKVLVDSFAKLTRNDQESSTRLDEWLATLQDYDVYYRLRRLFHCSYEIHERLGVKSSLSPGHRDHYAEVWREINHQIKLLEIVRYAMETAVDNAAIPLDDLANASASEDIALKKWLAVQNILHDVLLPVTVQYMADPNDSEESRAEKRIAFMEEPGGMRSRIEKLKGAKGDKRNEGLGNILLDLDRQQRGIIGRLDPQDPIRVAFCGFIIVDSYLFAMERTAGIEAKDVIHTVRISPIDAQRAHSHRTIDKKLCGDALGHFGGFLKASWRANDIMWGRLDGLCQLVECLVSPERIEALASSSRDERLRSTATKRVKPIYDWAQAHQTPLFPGASEQLCSQLRKDIEHLEEYAAKHIETHGKDSRFSDFISRLVEAAQAQILEEEIPRVLDCAITEQNRWNHYSAAPAPDSANPPYSEEKQAWTVGVKKIDPAVLAYAKRELLKKKEAGFWRKYFEDGKYSVGEESVIDGLPTPVLVEMVTHSAIILQNCAARAVGESRAQKIRNSLLYRIGVRYPIRTAYDFAIFQRTAPEYAKFLRTTMGVAASTALAVGVVWWDPLIWRQSVFAGKTFALLIGSPLLTFGLLALFKGVRAVWAALAGIVITVGVVALTHLKVIDLEYLRSIAGAIDVKVFVVGVVAGFVLPVLFRVIRSLIKRKAKATRDKAAGPGPGLGPGPKPPDPPDGDQLKRKAAGQPR